MKYQVKRSTGALASKKREENYTAECVPPSACLKRDAAALPKQLRAGLIADQTAPTHNKQATRVEELLL